MHRYSQSFWNSRPRSTKQKCVRTQNIFAIIFLQNNGGWIHQCLPLSTLSLCPPPHHTSAFVHLHITPLPLSTSTPHLCLCPPPHHTSAFIHLHTTPLPLSTSTPHLCLCPPPRHTSAFVHLCRGTCQSRLRPAPGTVSGECLPSVRLTTRVLSKEPAHPRGQTQQGASAPVAVGTDSLRSRDVIELWFPRDEVDRTEPMTVAKKKPWPK